MTILDTIAARKRDEVALLKSIKPRGRVTVPRFSEALRGRNRLSLIAEVKKASPVTGVIRADFDPVALARAYERAGASAISVLTDRDFFQGSIEDLRAVAQAVSVPVLRKDFIVDERQIFEAAEAGASAVLLIVAMVSRVELRRLLEVAKSLGLEALVEVHDARELESAFASGATIIGINNRDLATFEVDLNTTLDLAGRIPREVVAVSESGIRNRRDMARLSGKVDAVLVGTAILRCSDVSLKVHELFMNRPLLKVCGVRDVGTARACVDLGVDLLGFNFVQGNPRRVSPTLFRGVRFRAKTVGVFQNESLERVNRIARELDLNLVQLHGRESADYCARVERPVIKSFESGEVLFDGVIPLFDLPKGRSGVIQTPVFTGPFGLAGGLTPGNVRNAVGESCPLFVDVARGVETEGVIDLYKVQQFFNQIQTC